MRHRLAALLALPALLGAAPPPQASPAAAAECRLSFADAQKAVSAMQITRSSGEDPLAQGGRTEFYNPAGVTVLGQPASLFSRNEFEAEGVHRHIFRVDLSGSYADLRAAMLKAHGKASCDAHESKEPGRLGCMVHVRMEGASPERDVDMILFEHDGLVTTGCIYGYKPAAAN